MNKKLFVAGVISLFLLFGSTSMQATIIKTNNKHVTEYNRQSTDTLSRNKDTAKWTVMSYLATDNDLDVWSHSVLGALDQAVPYYDVEDCRYVVAQVDYYKGYNDNGFKNTAKRHDLREHIDTYTDIGEVNMADPDTLVDFVCWAIDNYPAEHYFLHIYDHGYAWGGLCWDYNNDHINNSEDFLTMNELNFALEKIKQYLGKNIDILFFEMCIMSHIEVYYSVADYVDYGVSFAYYGDGLYTGARTRAIEILGNSTTQEPGIAIEEIVKMLNQKNHFTKYYWIGVNCRYMNSLTDKIDTLAEKLNENFQKYKTQIKTAFESSTKLLGATDKAFWLYFPGQVDIHSFVSNIEKQIADEDIKNAAQDILDILDDAIIQFIPQDRLNQFGMDFGILCNKRNDENQYDMYKELEFAKDTQWDELIDKSTTLSKTKTRWRMLFQDNIFFLLTKLIDY